ncbi:MAG TPA: wax ester/triacylglycerol synthase family O-acyltransferase [Solirubrobacteraceae bacterium]|jgi:WS/DGAT/MGAT family acyltransferase|nr:wax ester/triacylglycerol synthase family O-acyltransferase [Solirubrobacteraceae bacterium]
MRQVSPVDAAWLALESRDTPMHVGGLFEFTLPDGAPSDFLAKEFERMREPRPIPPPWNLVPVQAPLLGPRLPLMREIREVDLDYHVRHSALPHPGGQRELGVLVSRLHSHQLDLHRPLWEVHLIEGLEGNRFAMYSKTHHSLVDGVSAMRLIMRALSRDSSVREMPFFWTVGAGERPRRPAVAGAAGVLQRSLGSVRDSATALGGLSRAGADLALAAVDDRGLQAPYRSPSSVLGDTLTGQRRFATQQYDLDRLRRLAKAAGCRLNDIVLYLSGTALRRYLSEHARVPDRPLTAGIPVNLREADDQSMGTAIGFMIAELGTNVAAPLERLRAIMRSTAEAKQHLGRLPHEARTSYTLLMNAPYIAGLVAGLGGRSPVPFSVGISNVPGPVEPLYSNGARLDALFPLSLLTHGNALNITCVSYAGTLNFGFTGARDTIPHLQRLAIYMGEALTEIEQILYAGDKAGAPRAVAAGGRVKPSAKARASAGPRAGGKAKARAKTAPRAKAKARATANVEPPTASVKPAAGAG